jgi:two-component system, NarL family, response regulator NreC
LLEEKTVTTLILADDHDLVRQGLRMLLEAESDFEVIGEFNSGLGVADVVEQRKPDILVIDVMMSGLNGLEVTRQIKQRNLETRVIVVSMHAEEAYMRQALANGAMGYVLKSSTSRDLVEAIRRAVSGNHYLSPPLFEYVIAVYITKVEVSDPYSDLTMREREVLQLAAEGDSSQQIGKKLSISARTVEIHRANMMRKLMLRNQNEVVRYALRQGMLLSAADSQ